MPTLTIRHGDTITRQPFEGMPLLSAVLMQAGHSISQPCGGRGVCGKCAVHALAGAVSQPSEAEKRAGVRLACQAQLLGDAQVDLAAQGVWQSIETGAADAVLGRPMPGRYGAAIDLGTTTLVARVFDLQTGAPLGEHALVNPQTSIAADVMGRISAALAGQQAHLQALAQGAVLDAVAGACAQAGIAGVDSMVVAGNTTMLYLLTGRLPTSLAVAPFAADTRFGAEVTLGGTTAYLPPCAGAFVGADITCAALAIGLYDQRETTLLMDIGTNGELMLWHNGKLYAASTAAGPAFEGGEISQGCGGIAGAIDKVWVEGNGLGVRVIGGGTPVGVCGSGLIDAIAALLHLGRIDPSGAADAPRLPLANGIGLTAGDVRAVQLAKAAIAAGIDTLLAVAGATPAQVHTLQLAGGFGSHLRVASAIAIGLIPAPLAGKAHAVGNASLAGAAALLLDTRLREKATRITEGATLVALGGDAGFEARFLADMDFPWAQEDE